MIDFSRTEDQQQFVKTAREFGREVLRPAEVAMDANPDPDAAFNSDIYWNTLAMAFELGFHKMSLPESHGGLGLDPVSSGMVWEELARWGTGFTAGLMAGSVVPQLVGFAAGHNKKMMERFVAPFCEDTTGKLVTAWGSSEPDLGSDGKNYHDPSVHHRTSAEKKEGRWVINGTKSNFVSNGGIADAYIVFACIERKNGLLGSGTFVVPADTPGVTRGKAVDRVGLRALNQAPVYFDDVEIPEENLIFPPGPGYPMLHRTIITVGNLGTGYLALGLLRAAYEDALEYARERVQWGKPIAEHQLVARRLFEINSAILSMRALLYQGSWHCKSQFPGNLINSVTAKITASKLARKHTAEMVQVLGGYGVSKDYRLEKYMRDAPLLEIMDGTNDTLMMELIPKLQPY
jgi:alkylation response protein AidB-like acyl-CoA dehydrogenase